MLTITLDVIIRDHVRPLYDEHGPHALRCACGAWETVIDGDAFGNDEDRRRIADLFEHAAFDHTNPADIIAEVLHVAVVNPRGILFVAANTTHVDDALAAADRDYTPADRAAGIIERAARGGLSITHVPEAPPAPAAGFPSNATLIERWRKFWRATGLDPTVAPDPELLNRLGLGADDETVAGALRRDRRPRHLPGDVVSYDPQDGS